MMTTAPNYSRTALGDRVARYRKWRGFRSARELAEAIPGGNVTRSTIVNIELGRKKDPSIGDLLGIAYALGVSPLALLVDVEEPFETSDLADLMPGEWAEISNLGLLHVLALGIPLTPQTPGGFRDPAFIFTSLDSLWSSITRLESLEARDVDPEVLRDQRAAVEMSCRLLSALLPSLEGLDLKQVFREVRTDSRATAPESWGSRSVERSNVGRASDGEHPETP